MFLFEKLEYCVVEFYLPYPLDLPNCITQENNIEGFIVVLNETPAMIRVERVFNEQPSLPQVVFAPGRVETDRYGTLSKTKIQVWFDEQTFGGKHTTVNELLDQERDFLLFAIRYANKLVFDYRRISRDFWLREISEKDVFSFRFVLLDGNGENVSTAKLIHRNAVHFNGGKGFHLPDDQLAKLRTLLQTDHINLFDDLCLSILDNQDKGEFNIALIQCAILFENFVYSNLKKKLSNNKLDKIKKKERCGCLVGINEVCTRGLREHFGVEFGETEQFQNYDMYVSKIRNKLVHGERIEKITNEECELAIEATHEAILYLKRELDW